MQATRSVWLNLQAGNDPKLDLDWGGVELSPLVIQILHNRGISAGRLMQFLGPDRGPVYDPRRLRGMQQAVNRVLRAREQEETVAVYGDSDVDGITGAVLLVQALGMLGIKTVHYVPNRQTEPAGVNREALQWLAQSDATLVITVDCGITSEAALREGQERGLDFVVTDHHAPPAVLPNVDAIIDPLQAGCKYPCKDLAGVGVAFKLAQCLLRAAGFPEECMQSFMDLVALGTIADMVPLVGENRALVWWGLSVLNHSSRPGLQVLIARSGLHAGSITAADVGYKLCPRLNAAGRIGNDSAAYALLTARSYEEAESYATILEQRNRERQHLTQEAYEACHEELRRSPVGAADWIVVAHIEPSASAVAGVLAGKLVEEYGLPAMVVQVCGDTIRGSLRGTTSFPILDALRSTSDLLSHYGGHQQAAGFVTEPEHLAEVTRRIRDFAASLPGAGSAFPQLRIDAELSPYDVGWQLHDQLQVLEPFGVGNPTPLFLCR